MSSPNMVNLLNFPTRTHPIEPHGATTVIQSENWKDVHPEYCTTSKWKPLIKSSSGRHQYIRFVRCMVRRISFNASNEAEIQAFTELILSDESEEFLWLAMPELPDCEQLPSDGPWHNQLLQLVTLLRPTVLKRKKNHRKYLQRRQSSSETLHPIDLSKMNIGLDREQQTTFAQHWFDGRNLEEPIGADQERLFKSHVALAYPACAVDYTEAQMQKSFRQPTKLDCMGLPQYLCFPGEELPAEMDLSGLPFFSPSSGQELPGVSRRYQAANPNNRQSNNQDTHTNRCPVTVIRAHKSVAQNLVNAGRTTDPVPPTTPSAQLSQNGPAEEWAQTLQENVMPRTESAEGVTSHIHDTIEEPRVRDFSKNTVTNQPSKPKSRALATGLSDSQASYIHDQLSQPAPRQPPHPSIPIADSISAQLFDRQPPPPFTSEQMADYIIKGHTDPTYRLNIPREKALEDRARITPKPSPYGGSYLGPEVGTSIDSSMNQYYIGRMSPGPGQAPSGFSQIGFQPDEDAWKWLLKYKGAPLSRQDVEWMEEMERKEVAVTRTKQTVHMDRNEAKAAEGSSQMAQEEKDDVGGGGIMKPEAGQGTGQTRPKVKKRVSFKEELD